MLFRSMKQWETDPKLLPASVARRLPVRTNYNDRYYNDTWEGIPVDGYTPIFERMLDHENIEVFLETDWFEVRNQAQDQLVVYTGPIDRYYDYCYGALAWRTLDFEYEHHEVGDYQGIAQVNYSSIDDAYTRIIEHRHFHPERRYPDNQTIIAKEYSRGAEPGDTVYYPVKTPEDVERYNQYRDLVEKETRVVFEIGRAHV